MSMAFWFLCKTLRHLNSVDKLKLPTEGVDLCAMDFHADEEQTAGLTAQREAAEQVS